MRTILLVLLSLAVILPVNARKQRTGPSRIAPVSEQAEQQPDSVPLISLDTITSPSKNHLRFSGYDKPNRATKETFFVTNNLPDSASVVSIEVTFTYSDMQGRMLHKATHNVDCDIPPGQTRKLSVRSWDSNNAFHYYRSQAPQRRQSTPYRVASSVSSAIIIPR